MAFLANSVVLPGHGFFHHGHHQRMPPKEEVEEIDLYEVLGVDEDATAKEIKSAYRVLSMECHPDRGGDETRFQSVSYAYEILSSEEKRFLYDQGGITLLTEVDKRDRQGHGGGPGINGFLGGFFGGGVHFGEQNNDFKLRASVTLEDLYKGSETQVRVSRRIVCRLCHKKKSELSAKAQARCKTCGRCPNEVKMVARNMGGMIIQQQEEVPSKHKCKDESKELKVSIERGMLDGAEVRFKYMSEQRPGQIPGDVVVVLAQNTHKRFERDGSTLKTTVKISLKDALTGFSTSIDHLDGHKVEIKRENTVTKPFQKIEIANEGMPVFEVPSEFGKLIVTFEVVFPDKLTKKQVEVLNELLA